MLPIALDLTRIPVLLVGSGELLLKRLAYLDEAKAGNVAVFCENASDALRKAAGGRLVERLPVQDELENYTVIMVVGLPRTGAERIVLWARLLGRLINVEDINDLCDFYFTANVRRGDLVIAVSTSGASPTLARKLRDWLADRFGEEWTRHVREVATLRKTLKGRGATMQEIVDETESLLDAKGWLKEKDRVL